MSAFVAVYLICSSVCLPPHHSAQRTVWNIFELVLYTKDLSTHILNEINIILITLKRKKY
jgi:hypothetical protein